MLCLIKILSSQLQTLPLSTLFCDTGAKPLKTIFLFGHLASLADALERDWVQVEGRGLFLLPFCLLFLGIILSVLFYLAAITSCCLQLPSISQSLAAVWDEVAAAPGRGPLGSQSPGSMRLLLKAPDYQGWLSTAPPRGVGPASGWPSPNFQFWQFQPLL